MRHTIVKISNVWDKNESSKTGATLIRTSSLKEVQAGIYNSMSTNIKKFI